MNKEYNLLDSLRAMLWGDRQQFYLLAGRLIILFVFIAAPLSAQQSSMMQQDSLRHLLETGQADTIHYNYREESFLSQDSTYSKIIVTPRVDSVPNRTGRKSAGLVLVLLVATASLSFLFARLAAKHVYKRILFSAPVYYGIHLVVGLLLIYPTLSNIYAHLDDMMIRECGTPHRAALSIKWGQYKSRNQYHSTYSYSFLFPGTDGVMQSVDEGKAEFDADCYPEWKPGHEEGVEREGIPVRYDEETRKLSVDDNTCALWNLYGVVSSSFFLLLLFWGSCGKFNKLAGRAAADSTSEKESANNLACIDMPCLLSTYWTFSSKTYESMDEFNRDVKLSEQRHNLYADDSLNPDRIIIARGDVIIRVFDEDITGNNDLCIKITSDNGESITEGELLFKLHHQMIPYLRRLTTRTFEQIDFFGEPKEGKPVECIILFGWSD